MKPLASVPNCFDSNCRILLTPMFYSGSVAQTKSPQGVRNIVIVHGAWADGSSWSKVDSTTSSQRIPCGRRAEPIDLTG